MHGGEGVGEEAKIVNVEDRWRRNMLQMGGGGICRAADERELGEGGEGGSENGRGAGARENLCRARVHKRGAVNVGDKVSCLCERGLRQEIGYRGGGGMREWAACHGEWQPFDDNVGGASVARKRDV